MNDNTAQLFTDIWQKIITYEGEIFTTRTGKNFSYTIKGDCICHNTLNVKVYKSGFEEALHRLPLHDVANSLRGIAMPTYIYAILTDKRIVG